MTDADFTCAACRADLPFERMGRCDHDEPRCDDCEADDPGCPECVAEAGQDREAEWAMAERRGE